jgi:hypothetical protein
MALRTPFAWRDGHQVHGHAPVTSINGIAGAVPPCGDQRMKWEAGRRPVKLESAVFGAELVERGLQFVSSDRLGEVQIEA